MNYVFDIDGTLSFDGQKIAPSIIKALKHLEQQDNQLIFASARPIRDLLPIIPDFASQHLLIGGNGSMVQTQADQLRVMASLAKADIEVIKTLIEQYQLHYIMDGVWDYAARVDKKHAIYQQLDPAHLAHQVQANQLDQPVKIILIDIPEAIYQQVLACLNQLETVTLVEHSDEASLDITARGINKYTTLTSYSQDEYIAFGNDHNDFELLQHAKRSIWVGENNSRLRQSSLRPTHICEATDTAVSALIETML